VNLAKPEMQYKAQQPATKEQGESLLTTD